ncbi:MAG: hypothetical protein PHR82_07685 [Endomicrobiaceae bacterium]|nr:hypothetical protein [Endomicrobiaceae bacterium]
MASLHFILCGIITILLQIFFIREFVPIFHGNEFSIATVLANWLFATGVSSYIFSHIKNKKDNKKKLITLFLILILLLTLSFVFIRSINLLTDTDITEGISLKSSVIFAFISIAPIAFVVGLIFGLLNKNIFKKHKNALGNAHIYESAGFVLGGLVFSFFLSSISTSILLSIIISLIFVNLFLLFKKRAFKLLTVLLLLFVIYVIENYTTFIENSTILNNYKSSENIEVSYFDNQQYILTESNGEFAFYKNGILNFAVPSPTIYEDDDFAHLPILYHDNPKNILLIGGVKYLPSITKFSLDSIDYIDLDEDVIAMLKNKISRFSYILSDDKIRVYNVNARQYLENSNKKYDVVLIGLDIPINTATNSFYTQEFFEIAKNNLTENGFIALKLPGAMVYSDQLMSKLNASVYNALNAVFKSVVIIPGTQNILIATENIIPYRLDLKKRLRDIEYETFVLSKYYVDERMDTQKTQWLKFQLDRLGNEKLINTDKNQKAMIYSIMYWQSAFSPFLMKFFQTLIDYSYMFMLIPVLLFFSVRHTYKITAFVAGASSMWLQMICFWAFQIYAGHIYKWFGLLIAIFMAGSFFGITYAKYKYKTSPLNKTFFRSEIVYLLWIILCFVVIQFQKLNWIYILIFLFGTGFMTGLQFFQISKAYSIIRERYSQMKIYSSDAFGGCFASGLGGAFLIPVWGIEKSLLFILFFKFLVFAWWGHKNKHGL